MTQTRLDIAQLTHCMRWLGMAQRALEVAAPYVKERWHSGTALAEHEGVQWVLAEAAMQTEIGRPLTMKAAWKIEQSERAAKQVSMAEIHVSETRMTAVYSKSIRKVEGVTLITCTLSVDHRAIDGAVAAQF